VSEVKQVFFNLSLRPSGGFGAGFRGRAEGVFSVRAAPKSCLSLPVSLQGVEEEFRQAPPSASSSSDGACITPLLFVLIPQIATLHPL